jgi:tetratricopeptide (TPR) repeat protein
MTRRICWFVVSGSLAIGWSAPSFGQDAAGAELLVKEGQKYVAAGQLAEGCATFARALELQVHPRILVNLADCHEKQGKLASALAEYSEARRLSKERSDSDPREQKRQAYAEEKIQSLEPRISFLQVDIDVKPAGFQLLRGDRPVPVGAKIAVDPGAYSLTAQAPGYSPWKLEITIQGEGTTRVVKVPPLQPETTATPSSAASSPPPPSSAAASAQPPGSPVASTVSPPGPRRTTAGWAVAGGGLAAVGVGIFFAQWAHSAYTKADGLCPEHKHCQRDAMDQRDTAERRANVANATVSLGIAAMGIGTYLLRTSPGPEHEGTTATGTPWVGPDGAGILVRGRF